jgi:hypothetical protein
VSSTQSLISFFWQWVTLIGPRQKNHDTLILPKYLHFVPIWDMVVLFQGNFEETFCPTSLLNKKIILNFGRSFYKRL